MTARYCALREAVIATFCPDPEFVTLAQKDACTAFFQRFEARFDRYPKERGLFQDGVKELQNFSHEHGIDASLLVPEEGVAMHQAFQRFNNRGETQNRVILSWGKAQPINYIVRLDNTKTQVPKAEGILERLQKQVGKTLPEITLKELNKYYKTCTWEPWYQEAASDLVRPDWWDAKELNADQKAMEKDFRAWTLPRLQIMRAMTIGLHLCRILVHHLDEPLRPGADKKTMPPYSEEMPIRNLLPMSVSFLKDRTWIGIVNLHLEKYLWKYDWHSTTWDADGIKGMHEMHEALCENMTVEPKSGMTYHALYNKFRMRRDPFMNRRKTVSSKVLSALCSLIASIPTPITVICSTNRIFRRFTRTKKEFIFLNREKGLHDYHSPQSGLIDRILPFRGDGKKENAEPSWQEKEWEKERAKAYADASLAAYAWEHCSVERVTRFMRKVFGNDITDKYLQEYDINAVLEAYRTKNPYWLNAFAVCRYATDEKGAYIFDEQGKSKENPTLKVYQHVEEKGKHILENDVKEFMKEEETDTPSASLTEFAPEDGAEAADLAGQTAQKAQEEAVLDFQRQAQDGTAAS